MNNFLIYKSSAGSGKTFTLVKEYLRLALSPGGDFRHILAVTFTNKAAEEMKSRVISALIGLTEGNAPHLERELINSGLTGAIKLRAAKVLKDILHKYSYFSILTIDSFFHKIIRSFARELKIQLGYNIEIDVDMVLDKITEELLDEFGANPELSEYIEEFVSHSIDENKGWKIEGRIKELAKEIFNERYWIKKAGGSDLADSREKMREFIDTLRAVINAFEKIMRNAARESFEIIAESGLEPADFKNGTFSYFKKLSIKDNYPENIEPGKIVRKIIDGQDNWYAQKSTKKGTIAEAAANGLDRNLKTVIEHYDSNFRQYITAKELIKTVYVLGIYKDLMDRLKHYRDENRILLISDLNNILMKIISGDNSPFVYEKTGSRYKHFLIDEFQDTSTFQWANFLPLVQNSLAENNFSMVVGDVKQSIYRWRNGNMKLLLEGVKSDLQAFSEITSEEALNRNFRSRNEIISFNNIFFRAASALIAEKNEGSGGDLIAGAYDELEQEPGRNENGGYINAVFIDSNDEEGDFDYLAGARKAIQFTIRAVEESLKSGYMQKDILVLTRYIREGAETAHHLISSGFKVVSNESLLLTSSPKVKLLINLLKYISDSRNNLAKTDLLYEYIVYVKNETPEFNPLFTDYRNPEATVFTDIMPAEFFAAGDKTKLNPAFFRLSLYELLEMLIRIFSLNNSADAYLLRFLELVIEYSSQNTNDITGFLEWWSVNCDEYSIVVPEQEDAVRVMTIHKAKGLQSPVVIIPFANWELDISSGDLIWASSGTPPFSESSAYLVRAGKTLKKTYFEKDFDEEAVLTNLDNLNLLYVAFTRAVDRLYIAVPSKPTKTNTGSLVKNVLHHNMELSHALVSENEFKMGVPAENNNKEAAGDASYKAGEMLCTEYYSRTVVRPASAGISIEKAKKYAQLKNRGILLHKALSLIKYPDEAESAYEQLKIQGLITSENEDEFIGELIDILKNEEIKPWFSREYEIKTESELALPDGRVYKPDRVLIKDKKAIVIDYKTGKHKKEHKTQILQYAEILEQMGYNGIEKYLFYVPEREVVKL